MAAGRKSNQLFVRKKPCQPIHTSGVTSATVDFHKKIASVTFDPDKAGPVTLTKATREHNCFSGRQNEQMFRCFDEILILSSTASN
jgi:hypothetical protein